MPHISFLVSRLFLHRDSKAYEENQNWNMGLSKEHVNAQKLPPVNNTARPTLWSDLDAIMEKHHSDDKWHIFTKRNLFKMCPAFGKDPNADSC